MDAQVTKDNETFKLSDLDIVVKDFNVSSISLLSELSYVEGRSGSVDYGATYDSRSISIPFIMTAKDLADYPLLRDEIYSKLVTTKPFYISEMRRSKFQAYNFVDINGKPSMNSETDNQLVSGKRYKVRITNTMELDQMLTFGEGVIELETIGLPFAESVATTQDIQRNGVDANSHLWGFGMGIIEEPASRKYTFKNAINFKVFNAGNVPVHPFEQELKITITNIKGANSSFELLNKTNGSFIKITNSLKAGDTIIIDGPTITRNNAQYLRHTTRNFVWLTEAYNDFEIIGADSADIEFDFKFYYK